MLFVIIFVRVAFPKVFIVCENNSNLPFLFFSTFKYEHFETKEY